jgi:S-adenosylmethionine hydrolase
MARTIAILTDFGYTDNYVGIMKGVIRKISPFADIIDLNNGIAAGDILSAAYELESAYRYFPDYTIFLCVVDPGVGSTRRAVAIEAGRKFFVAPDNGILTPIIRNEKIDFAVNLNNTKYHNKLISNTFHGRDIFATVAAHIAQKTELHELGESITTESLIVLDNLPKIKNDYIEGEIVHSDNFGNLITNIKYDDFGQKKKRDLKIVVAGYEINGLVATYSDVGIGELFAYTGSSNYLEIAINGGSAAKLISKKEKVIISYYGSSAS